MTTKNSEHTKGKLTIRDPLDMEGMRHIFIESEVGNIGRIDGHFRGLKRPTAEEATANAERLVKCWNCHNEFVAALVKIAIFARDDDEGENIEPIGIIAKAALAKEKEQ